MKSESQLRKPMAIAAPEAEIIPDLEAVGIHRVKIIRTAN
jgi:hypothetical protein